MKTSLWLAALPLALSAPLGTQVLETAPLAKRGVSLGFSPVSLASNQCGSSSFNKASSGRAATRDDCNSLVSGLRGQNKHWELDNGGGTGSKWISIASFGSCHFWVDRSNFQDTTVGAPTLIGTDDVADIVQDSITRFQDPGITLELGGATNLWTVDPAQGTVQCPFNDAGKVPWRIQLDKP